MPFRSELKFGRGPCEHSIKELTNWAERFNVGSDGNKPTAGRASKLALSNRAGQPNVRHALACRRDLYHASKIVP